MQAQVRVPKRVLDANKEKGKGKMSTAKVNVKQGVRIALITPTHLRNLLKDGKIAGKKLPNGEWSIEVASLREFAKRAQEKLDKRVQSLKDGTYGQNVRPTTATAQRMRKFVENDTILTKEEKISFFSAINRYEIAKDIEYLARLKKAEGK